MFFIVKPCEKIEFILKQDKTILAFRKLRAAILDWIFKSRSYEL